MVEEKVKFQLIQDYIWRFKDYNVEFVFIFIFIYLKNILEFILDIFEDFEIV